MLINVDLGDGVIQQMDDSALTPNHSVVDNEHEHTQVTEFRLDGKIVHRSVHVHLKQGIGIEAILGSMG